MWTASTPKVWLPGVQVSNSRITIHMGITLITSLDLGYKGAPVVPLPPNTSLSGSSAHNPYLGLNAQSAHLPWAAREPQQTQPGYSSSHMHYDDDRNRYMRQSQVASPGRVLTIKVQAFYELEKATVTKFCEPFQVRLALHYLSHAYKIWCQNILDTIAVDPTSMPRTIARQVRQVMEQAFKDRKGQFRYFTFDLQAATVRDLVGTNLEKAGLEDSYPRGYYYDLVMVEKAHGGKKAAAVRVAAEKQFKQPKITPVVAFILPYEQYSRYVDFIIEREVRTHTCQAMQR